MHRYAACNYENCILSSQNLTICILTLTSSSSYDPQHFKQVSNNFNLFLEVFSRLGFCSLVCKFYRITQSIIMTHWLNRKNLPKSQAVLMTWITGDFAGWFQSDFKLFQSGFGGPFWRVIYIYIICISPVRYSIKAVDDFESGGRTCHKVSKSGTSNFQAELSPWWRVS